MEAVNEMQYICKHLIHEIQSTHLKVNNFHKSWLLNVCSKLLSRCYKEHTFFGNILDKNSPVMQGILVKLCLVML